MSELVMKKLIQKLKDSPKLIIGDTEIILELDNLDDYHIKKAERELRESSELVQESFKILGEMLREEEDLFIPLEENFLRRFLRRCKWYPKSAFKLIKHFYEYKKNHPEFFDNLLPNNEQAVFISEILIPLPRRAVDGLRIVVIQAGRKWNPKDVSLNQIFRGLILNLIMAITEPKTQVSGVRVILDMEGLSLRHVTYFTPRFASAIIEFLQKCLPCRLKGVHIVNQSFIFDMVFALFKPFLHGKLRDRIYFHGEDKLSILTYIDAEVLPKKYGGEFDFPEQSMGELLYKHLCIYEDYLIDTLANITENEKAHIFEFPYLVSLRIHIYNTPFCSGVILSKFHIITAAKCVDGKEFGTEYIGIFLGSSSAVSTDTPMYSIERINLHPDYTGQISMRSIYEHNIAIITVKEVIIFHRNQNKIQLATKAPENRDSAITSGWGLNSYSYEETPQELKKCSMTIINNLQCSMLLPFVINDGQLCAYKSNSVGPVDAGGPLISDGKLVGIMSYMRTSPKTDPCVYTNVYHYSNFIRSIVTH